MADKNNEGEDKSHIQVFTADAEYFKSKRIHERQAIAEVVANMVLTIKAIEREEHR